MPDASANTELTVSPENHTGYASIAEIMVDAPPQAIWPHLLDAGSWIYDFHFESVSGPPNGQGEVRHLWPAGVDVGEKILSVVPSERTADNASIMKTLALVTHKLWHTAMPLKGEDSGAAGHGANIVVLTELDGGTLVTAVRSKEWYCPNKAVCADIANNAPVYQPIAQRRWVDLYLPRLKALSEASWGIRAEASGCNVG